MKNALLACGFLVLLTAAPGNAEVARVDVTSRRDVLGGRAFGAAGAYEWIEGRAYFTLDPSNPRNQIVTDVKLAPRNSRGLVEFSADLGILRPKDSAKANGAAIFDVVNRGRRTVLGYLNRGSGTPQPAVESYFGDGFLMKHGYTVVWLGFQQDPPETAGSMRLYGPVLEGVTGLVQGDIVVSERLAEISPADRGSIPYAVANPNASENKLTVRASRTSAARVVPRDQWSLANNPTRIQLKGGFEPGAVYEYVYVAKQPFVAGLGLAAVRDVMSWVRNDPAALVRADRTLAYGQSFSGRFLRQFLHDGFNADLSGKPVFDGMMIHVGGGARRGFNERFTQPSRNTLSMVFPFTDVEQTDKETGQRGSILSKAREANVVPKIVYTSSAWEYWGAAASTVHTTVDGAADITIPDTSRFYFIASTKHASGTFPPEFAPDERGQAKLNPGDYRPVLRALWVALDQWVRAGTGPPPSQYPRIAGKTLVSRAQLRMKGFQKLNAPAAPWQFFRLDNGERVPGVPASAPPRQGKPYVTLVPQVDDDGNDVAGVRLPEIAVPLGTYTGWNLRDASIGAPGDFVRLAGSYFGFPRTVIEKRYGSSERYLELVNQAARKLVDQRFMLADDVGDVLKRAEQHWKYAVEHQ